LDKERKQFKCKHFTKFCAGLHEIFVFHGFNFSSFVISFNLVIVISLCQDLPWSKTTGFCRNADDPQPNKHFTKQNDISRTEQRSSNRRGSAARLCGWLKISQLSQWSWGFPWAMRYRGVFPHPHLRPNFCDFSYFLCYDNIFIILIFLKFFRGSDIFRVFQCFFLFLIFLHYFFIFALW